tara:strand:- start:1179 stop:1508 length:330 start_codon:yes stop_codon:yes gene_type:complete
MPKFNGQNKKKIDPRYFMDEKKETISESKEEVKAEGQYPSPSGDSVTDEDVVRSVYNLLKDNQSSGYRALAGRFMEMMKERGVISQESGEEMDKSYKARAARLAGIPGI